MNMLADIWTSIDWPNVLAGAIISLLVGFFVWAITGAYEAWMTSKRLPYDIRKKWYSAEFDPKGDTTNSVRNTFRIVHVRRRMGGGFKMRVVGSWPNDDPDNDTAWKLEGKIHLGDTFVGNWHTTAKNTKRFGAACIKFFDNGRAIGYWIGPAGVDHPVYGYWVMARSPEMARAMASEALTGSGFNFVDVVGHLLNYASVIRGQAGASV